MPARNVISRVEQEAQRLLNSAEAWEGLALKQRQKAFELMEKAANRPEAPPVGSWMTVEVQFRRKEQWYRYLILNVSGKGYYTTGTAGTSHFPTWDSLMSWLESGDVYQHSSIAKIDIVGPTYVPAKTVF